MSPGSTRERVTKFRGSAARSDGGGGSNTTSGARGGDSRSIATATACALSHGPSGGNTVTWTSDAPCATQVREQRRPRGQEQDDGQQPQLGRGLRQARRERQARERERGADHGEPA